MTHRVLFWILILVALVGYSLPWVTTPGVSTSLGAYDLAEWASLHPAARAESPPLLTSFLLRLPLALIALIIAVGREHAGSSRARALVVLLLALALLPPLEFFTQYRDDPNYRQQFGLALLALIGGLTGLSGWLRRWADALAAGLTLIGVIAVIWGANQGYRLLADFSLPVSLGAGILLVVASLVLLALLHISPGGVILTRNRAARA